MSPGSSKEREEQALARQNKVGRRPVPLTLRDKPIPTQTFSPAEPQPNTGDFQDGIVSIQAPDIRDAPDGRENFYGRIIIYQD